MRIDSLLVTRRLTAAVIAALIALSSQQADAGRKAPKPTIAGAKTRGWKANGTRFEHETLKMHGNIVHWERRATGKSGVTAIRGKTWGSSFTGQERKRASETVREVSYRNPDGSARTVSTVTDKKGTVRTTIGGAVQ